MLQASVPGNCYNSIFSSESWMLIMIVIIDKKKPSVSMKILITDIEFDNIIEVYYKSVDMSNISIFSIKDFLH